MMIPVSLSPEMNSPVIQDDITSCTASSSSSESEDEKAAATKVCKDTENVLQLCAWCECAIHEQAHLLCMFCFCGPGVSGATFCKYARCNFIIRTLYIVSAVQTVDAFFENSPSQHVLVVAPCLSVYLLLLTQGMHCRPMTAVVPGLNMKCMVSFSCFGSAQCSEALPPDDGGGAWIQLEKPLHGP